MVDFWPDFLVTSKLCKLFPSHLFGRKRELKVNQFKTKVSTLSWCSKLGHGVVLRNVLYTETCLFFILPDPGFLVHLEV